MKIAIILGSVRAGRKTGKVAHYLHHKLADIAEISPLLMDLRERNLPLLTDRWEKQPMPSDTLAQFSQELKGADAMIFVTPEYHGSYSGVLKNAVDHFWKEFHRKPIGVVCTGSGKFGGINASMELQHLILSLGAYPMPMKLLVPHVGAAFEEDLIPRDESFKKSAQIFLDEFLWFCRAIVNAKLQVPTIKD